MYIVFCMMNKMKFIDEYTKYCIHTGYINDLMNAHVPDCSTICLLVVNVFSGFHPRDKCLHKICLVNIFT